MDYHLLSVEKFSPCYLKCEGEQEGAGRGSAGSVAELT